MSKSVLTNYPHDKAAQGQSIAEMGHALAEIRQASLEIAPASDMAALRQAVFGITGMDCADCAAKLERVVSRLDGVAQARVNFATAKMDVRFKPGAVSTEAIVQTVRGMGYDVSEARMADRAKPQVFRLTGLECADCAEKLEKKLSAIPGVEKAQVNFGASKLTVSTALAPERIAKAVAEAGYGAIFEGGKTSRTTIFRLKGLDCADCAAKVQKRVSLLDGVESAEVNFGASKMTVVGPVVPAAVIKAVNESGYSATIEGTGGTTRTTQFRVLGMDCADCATKLEKRLSVLPGVSKAAVNFGAGKLTVEHSAPISAIVKAVDEAGFYAEPEVVEKKTVEEAPFWRRNFRTVLTAVSALSVGVGFLLEWFKAPEAYAIAAYLVAMISGGFFVARAGIYGLKARTLDTNFLMTVAAVGAAAIGQWSEGAVVVMLFSLGNTLQAYTMDKTRQSIRALMELAPKEALVRRDGIEMRLPVEEILVGDVIVVRPGEKIAMDGVVRAGASAVNQAPITGESLPVEKTVGDEVFAGTINEQGSLEVSVTRLAEDNTLSKIMNMVEEAQAQKAPSQQFVDVFAKYYTPAIILAAMGIAVVPWLFGAPFQIWFYRALVLLVIACPCALVV
ncbi:MAG: heavy metal translocating P-type ATPase [Firmicutes bacterium]|nr:heavy metal translocating P-type ATPase [Bacillota bacterium]